MNVCIFALSFTTQPHRSSVASVKARVAFEANANVKSANGRSSHIQPSRRRKGPAFLPSEHDELPAGVAFMVGQDPSNSTSLSYSITFQTLDSHSAPITALDFSEPYGRLVSASQETYNPCVWDLMSGTEIGKLRGHTGTVKCIQVEDHVCLTGSEDGSIRIWDLRRIGDDDEWAGEMDALREEDESVTSESLDGQSGRRVNKSDGDIIESGCARILDGHSKAVTALYFEDDCLVSRGHCTRSSLPNPIYRLVVLQTKH